MPIPGLHTLTLQLQQPSREEQASKPSGPRCRAEGQAASRTSSDGQRGATSRHAATVSLDKSRGLVQALPKLTLLLGVIQPYKTFKPDTVSDS